MSNPMYNLEFPAGYKPIEKIGEGAYGVVFKAIRPVVDTETGAPIVDEATGRQLEEEVAIKKIKDYSCVDRGTGNDFKERYLRRICREVDILLHFRPIPQVVETKDIYLSRDGRDLYIVMTFIPLCLMRVMRTPHIRDALTEDHVRWISCQVLLGLSAMHRCGCMHRDLSLGNVLIDTTSWDCFLADFGLSRVQFESELDISLDVVSLPYRAPEVLMQVKRYTHPVDVWSVGCVVVELLLKKPFLHAKDALKQLWAIMDCVSGFPVLEDWESMASGTAITYLKKVEAKAKENGSPLPAKTDFVAHLTGQGVSHEAAQVVDAMLVFHPSKRATVDELLKMDWFQNNANCKELIDGSVASLEEMGPCPCVIESMNREQLVEHMKECVTSNIVVADSKQF